MSDELERIDLPSGRLNPVAELSDAEWEERLEGLARVSKRMIDLYKRAMTDGVHYGTIPGTDKPTLLKAGAELIFKLFGCAPVYERTRTYGDGEKTPPITQDSVCRAFHLGRQLYVAEGAGSCNTWEKKYRYRNAQRVCPECAVAAIIKGSAQYGGGFVCWARRDGCGAKFADDDRRILDQVAGQVDNPDPHDQENTIVKMADKRSFVACALTLGGASGFFAQDLEDDPPHGADDAPPPARGPAASASDAAIDTGKQRMLQDLAAKRAKALGIDDAGAGATLLSDVLKRAGYVKVEEVAMSQLNVLIQAVGQYELPK